MEVHFTRELEPEMKTIFPLCPLQSGLPDSVVIFLQFHTDSSPVLPSCAEGVLLHRIRVEECNHFTLLKQFHHFPDVKFFQLIDMIVPFPLFFFFSCMLTVPPNIL